MPINPNRQYRNVQIPFAANPAEKRIQSDFYVEGFFSTFNDPYLMYEYDGVKYFEMIDRHAFDGADMSDVIMQFDHQGRVMARISNNTMGIELLDYGPFMYADLSRSNAARDLHGDIDAKLVTKMSWAFTVPDDGIEYDRETHTNIIRRIKKVYDVSAVSIPANDATEISARALFDGVIERERQELRERERALRELDIARKRLEIKLKIIGGNN